MKPELDELGNELERVKSAHKVEEDEVRSVLEKIQHATVDFSSLQDQIEKYVGRLSVSSKTKLYRFSESDMDAMQEQANAKLSKYEDLMEKQRERIAECDDDMNVLNKQASEIQIVERNVKDNLQSRAYTSQLEALEARKAKYASKLEECEERDKEKLARDIKTLQERLHAQNRKVNDLRNTKNTCEGKIDDLQEELNNSYKDAESDAHDQFVKINVSAKLFKQYHLNPSM